MVTDLIEAFDSTGICLASGTHLDANIIVTATKFELNVLGDIQFAFDGQPMDFSQTVTWRGAARRGAMFSGIPNICWIFGHLRASWTLRVDLVADRVCHLLNHTGHAGHA